MRAMNEAVEGAAMFDDFMQRLTRGGGRPSADESDTAQRIASENRAQRIAGENRAQFRERMKRERRDKASKVRT